MLDTNTAVSEVFDLLTDQANNFDNPVKARMDFSRGIVAIMAKLVRSGSVAGTVTTMGSATTQTGLLTGGKLT